CRARPPTPWWGPGRADLVLSGCAILDAICATWPVGRLRVADRGIREGILFELMQDGPEEGAPGRATGLWEGRRRPAARRQGQVGAAAQAVLDRMAQPSAE